MVLNKNYKQCVSKWTQRQFIDTIEIIYKPLIGLSDIKLTIL
jgi:hypothetical protein